jgi:hypothetical protein
VAKPERWVAKPERWVTESREICVYVQGDEWLRQESSQGKKDGWLVKKRLLAK